MPPYERMNTYRGPSRRRFSLLPWLFVLAVAVVVVRHWVQWPRPADDSPAARDAAIILKNSGSPDVRHRVDVIRTVDGDTFEARVHLQGGLDPTARVRLRGIDAPELKASCPEELQMAEAASAELRRLLGEGEVAIFNIGPDKYSGRVVAEVATKKTGNVSAALLAAGFVRSYSGGHRSSWCANAGK
jgi:endonuclease YncB( thermonuclease family)